MAKHLLVMAVAAPLLLLGAAHLPIAYPFLSRPRVERLTRALTHPVFCWLSATLAVIVWHVPAVFRLGMSSPWWHNVQFTCFLVAGLLFWWPVIQPWQTERWSRWFIPLYLFLATLPCDALSAYLTFCDYVVYAPYLRGSPALASALQDQQAAGALMWVCITFVYLLPAVLITMEILSPRGRRDQERASTFAENPGTSRPVVNRPLPIP
jgi:cytochrome c oxidase assembly factor CtaG